jgi:hypothetical protein
MRNGYHWKESVPAFSTKLPNAEIPKVLWLLPWHAGAPT